MPMPVTNTDRHHCNTGHLELVQFFVENGADSKTVNDDGWTSLRLKCNVGKFDLVKGPIGFSCIEGNLDVVKMLACGETATTPCGMVPAPCNDKEGRFLHTTTRHQPEEAAKKSESDSLPKHQITVWATLLPLCWNFLYA